MNEQPYTAERRAFWREAYLIALPEYREAEAVADHALAAFDQRWPQVQAERPREESAP